MVNVFGFRVVQKLVWGGHSCPPRHNLDRSRLRFLSNRVQPINDGRQFGLSQHSRAPKRPSVGSAGGDFEGQQPPIIRKRPLPLLKFRVKRLPEAARPHLHR
jgi:hypothetical protein